MKLHCICFSLLLILHINLCHSQQKEGTKSNGGPSSHRRPKPPLIDNSNIDISEKTDKNKPARRNSNEFCQLCRYMYLMSDKEFMKTKDVDKFCIRLKQVNECIDDLKREKIYCTLFFNLYFKAGVKIQTRKHNCAQRNVTSKDLENIFITNKNDIAKRTEIGQNCRYRENNGSSSELNHCGMFGDPHIKTFFGERQTCVVAGTWTLVDNEYMKIEAVNEMVQDTESTSATATKEITIAFKERDLVCTREKKYKATSNSLPEHFQDGSTATGPASCKTEVFVDSPYSVKLKSCRSNTTILIRRVGKYLTFNILTPFDIVNKSSGLCQSGCPANERVDFASFFHDRIHQNDISQTLSYLSTKEAISLCLRTNVTDFYFDSCVFDLLTTGDRRFSQAARLAMLDASSMDPKLRLRRANSVVLKAVRDGKMSSASTTKSLSCYSLALIILMTFVTR